MDALWLWYAAAALCLLWTAFTFAAGESRATANLPPGPRGLPVVGNLLQLGMKPKESLAALAAKHGPLMTLRLGMRTTIVVSSPAMAKEILKTQDNIFAGRTVPHTNEALGHCNTGIVFAQQGPHLRMLRRVSAMHLFTPKQLQSLQPLRHLKLVEMLQHVLLCCCGGQERLINVWAIGRDPAVWTEPQSFQPQRFVGSEIDFRGQHFELIPFGAGRRMCVGMALAAKMIHITLARLLQCFDWSLPRGFSPAELDMSDVSGITMEKTQPLLLHPSPRLPLHLYSPCEI